LLFLAIRLGARNLFRNRRRAVITALSVAFGVCVAVVFIGTRQSMYDRLIDSGAKSGYGLLSLSQPGFIAEPSPSSQFSWDESLRQQLAQLPGVTLVAPRIAAMAVIATSKSSTGAALLGIDPEVEPIASNQMLANLVYGTALAPGDQQGCLIGTAMAAHLGVNLGEKVIFTTTDRQGQIVSSIAYVRGTFKTGSLELDGHLVVLPLALMRQTLDYPANGVSFLAIFAPPESDLAAIGEALKHRLGSLPLELSSWRKTLPDVAQAIDLDASLYRVLFTFTGIIVSIGILNTMMLNILERRREFGVMLALGLTPVTLVSMVLSEALMIGLLGLVLGALVAAPLYWYLHQFGLDLTIFLKDGVTAQTRGIEDLLGCRLVMGDIKQIAFGLIAMNFLAALYPAVAAARTVPILAIRAPQ